MPGTRASILSQKHYFLVTLGCFRNEVESDMVRSELEGLGLLETKELELADLVLVNTCGFISDACQEGIDTILELDRLTGILEKPPPTLVLGCMGQRYGTELMSEMPEISGVLGVDWKGEIEQALVALLQGKRFQHISDYPEPSRCARSIDSWEGGSLLVRVADGCDRACRFCAIPSIRGGYQSRDPDEICDEIERLSGGTKREVILLAQDLTHYGVDLPERPTLAGLLRRITGLECVEWVRCLYLQPEGMSPELIDEMSQNPVVCDYFDIPFQHASKKILKRMGRPGDSSGYLQLISRIRERSPDAALRTTVMVGFPGESDEDFDELLRFVEEIEFDWLGVFIYSPEEGTPAASLEGAPLLDTVRIRYDKIVELQDAIEDKRVSRMFGRELEVVVDGISELEEYALVGRSYREAPLVDGAIYLRDSMELEKVKPGDFIIARITGREGLDLVGEIQRSD